MYAVVISERYTAWTDTQMYGQGYHFTKGLTQNLNLRTNLKNKYNIKSLNYIQPNFKISSLVSILLDFVFYFFYMVSGLKVITVGNNCVTLQFA